MFSKDISEKIPSYADIIYDVLSFAGGMNSRASQLFVGKSSKFALHADQAPLLVNWVRTSSGQLQSRMGRVKVNSSAVVPPGGDTVIRSLFELVTQAGVYRILMNAGNSIYYLNGSTWSSLGTVATANQRMIWVQFNDYALGINGTDSMVQVDGTPTLSTVAAAPTTGTAMASHRNRVWIVVGRTLKYCALGNHTDWTTPNNAGAVPIPTTHGGGGTALLSLWDRLIVWTTDQVFQVVGTGPSTFSLEPINIQYGHRLSPYGAIAAGNDIFYGSQNGCHSLGIDYSQSITGDVSYNYVSGRIEPTWQAINKNNLANVVAVHDSARNLLIFLCNRTGTNNNEALVADYYHLDEAGNPTWSIFSNMPFASAAEVFSINSTKEVIFGSYDGYVYRQTDIGTDDGSSMDVQLQYVTDLDVSIATKLWRYMLVFANAASQETLIGTVTYDFGQTAKNVQIPIGQASGDTIGSTFIIGTSVLGSVSYRQYRIGIAGHGRFLTLNLSGSVRSKVTLGGLIFYAGIRRVIHH